MHLKALGDWNRSVCLKETGRKATEIANKVDKVTGMSLHLLTKLQNR